MERPIVLIFLLTLVGCGGQPNQEQTGSSALLGPHGNPVVMLGEAGAAEVVVESLKGKANASTPVIAVYFLEPDLKAPLARRPDEVRITVAVPGEDEPRTESLSSKPDAKDKVGAGRYATSPGPFDPDQAAGDLIVKLGQESYTLPFQVGR